MVAKRTMELWRERQETTASRASKTNKCCFGGFIYLFILFCFFKWWFSIRGMDSLVFGVSPSRLQILLQFSHYLGQDTETLWADISSLVIMRIIIHISKTLIKHGGCGKCFHMWEKNSKSLLASFTLLFNVTETWMGKSCWKC